MTDFIDDLGRRISKAAEDVSKKTEKVLEKQKLKNHIYTLERQIEKQLQEIGKIMYERYEAGESIDSEFIDLFADISHKNELIKRYQKEVGKMDGRTSCPECGSIVEKESVFCRSCGHKFN